MIGRAKTVGDAHPTKKRWLIVGALLVLASGRGFAQQPVEDGAPLGLADLAAEHAALAGKVESAEPPRRVTFRALWDHPETYRDARVIVSGRIVRVFRQGAVGEFSALAEAWIEEPPGNLFCAVFEPHKEGGDVEPGQTVAFTGVFLRRVRYQADGGPRLAPLIVGSKPPKVEKPAPAKNPRPADLAPKAPVSAWPEGLPRIGLFIGVSAVTAYLIWRSLYGQPPRVRRAAGSSAESDSAPEFVEPESADGDTR